jgi:hypothetical protein
MMTLFTLDNDRVRLQVAERGGAIEGYGGSRGKRSRCCALG